MVSPVSFEKLNLPFDPSFESQPLSELNLMDWLAIGCHENVLEVTNFTLYESLGILRRTHNLQQGVLDHIVVCAYAVEHVIIYCLEVLREFKEKALVREAVRVTTEKVGSFLFHKHLRPDV
jgi:hypothetical protein